MLHFILVLALRHGVDEKGFDAISLNMTKREVLTVLNRPPEPRPEVLRERPFPSLTKDALLWDSEGCQIWLRFDKQDRVTVKLLHVPGRQTNRTILFIPDGGVVLRH